MIIYSFVYILVKVIAFEILLYEAVKYIDANVLILFSTSYTFEFPFVKNNLDLHIMNLNYS